MSAPDPQLPQRKPLLPPQLAIRLAIAFGVGLLLFLLVWLNSRRDYDFYKADGTEATAGQADALPVPLPPDVAGSEGGNEVACVARIVNNDDRDHRVLREELVRATHLPNHPPSTGRTIPFT